MAKYHIDAIRELETQLAYSPPNVREEQLLNIEALIHGISPETAYPYEYVCYKITGYRPEATVGESFAGDKLRSDLCKLLEALSRTVNTPASSQTEPVYTVEDVKRLYSVSTRTVFRWRHKGLVSRKYAFNGHKRTGIRKSALEAFVNSNGAKVERSKRFSRLCPEEIAEIIRRATFYSRQDGLSLSAITERLSQELGRSREAVRYILRRHDRNNPTQRIFPHSSPPLTESQRRSICRDFLAGAKMAHLAKKYNRSRSALYRIVNQSRVERLLAEPIDYVYDEAFDRPDADQVILRDDSDDKPPPKLPPRTKATGDMPAYLRSLYATPLLTKEQEVALFRRYNYLKHKIAKAKQALSTSRPRSKILAEITDLQKQAVAVKDQLVSANLRLVVSVAKRHVGPLTKLANLISDGNFCLMRAVEKFDFTRGNKFSTYATWALIKNFARTIPEENYTLSTFVTGTEELLANAGDNAVQAAEEREFISALRHITTDVLRKLTDRERKIIVSRFGIGANEQPKTLAELGSIFGVTRERIRQIEAKALKKLARLMAGDVADLGIV